MKRAFTLVELMIVVAILGILAAIVLPGVQAHTADAREVAAKDCLRALRGQIEMYKMHHDGIRPGYLNGNPSNALTTQNQLIYCSNSGGLTVGTKSPAGAFTYGPYFPSMPENPFNNLTTISIVPNATAFSAAADGTSSGWLYKLETGEIKCNSTDTDGDGVKHYDY